MTEEQDLIFKAIKLFGSKGQVARELGYTSRGRAYHITRALNGTWNLPSHKLEKLRELLEKKPLICACCGYDKKHGVITSVSSTKSYVCLRCFKNPFLYFNAKQMLPMTMTTLKLRSRKMFKASMDYAQKRLY